MIPPQIAVLCLSLLSLLANGIWRANKPVKMGPGDCIDLINAQACVTKPSAEMEKEIDEWEEAQEPKREKIMRQIENSWTFRAIR